MSITELKQKLKNEPVFNSFLTIPSPWTAEVMANAGWPTLTVDMQHGLADTATAIGMLQAMSSRPVVPFIRLPWNEPSVIMKVLDAGAWGVICPMISTAAEVETFVGACRYPPRGYRSFGPIRARMYGEEPYAAFANDNLLAFAMIETAAAIDNLEAIAAVPGLDGLYIGPSDLSVSLGLERVADFRDPELLGVLDRVLAACAKNNLIPGVFTNRLEDAAAMAKKGFRFISYSDDTALLKEIGKGRLGELLKPPSIPPKGG